MKFQAKSEDTRNYVKLKSGESITGVFRGDLFEFRTHWGDKRTSVCKGETCELCAAGKKSTFRFRVNFVVKTDNGFEAKVMEHGWNFYDDLRALNEEYKPLENHIFKITRQGEKLSTKYSIFPVANGVVTPEKEASIEKVKLNDLNHMSDAEKESENPPIESYNDIPF